MPLVTDLSRSPYFDDFRENKNFYRVLYRPGVAVQTRELNQMQSILQDQINKFGRHIFKEGSIVEGCAFTFDNKYTYVKIQDNYANGTAFTIDDFTNQKVYNSNGLEAVIVNVVPGFESQAPNLNTLYIKYNNSATYPNGAVQSAFANGEQLVVATQANVAIGNVVVATVANSTGSGYAFTTTAGTIFKKGFFISVNPQTIIVKKYDNYPDDISVGFDAVENIITPEADTSLYDNAAGSPNYTAPGAHRLQLIPTLITRVTSQVESTDNFFSLCDFKAGKPVSIKNDPQYAALGADMARRTFETNGNYIIYPFVLSTEQKPESDPLKATHLNLVSSRGVGYVEGYRVEFVNNNRASLRKGTDIVDVANKVVGANFGYYVNVNQYAGEFDTNSIVQVELHSVAKAAVDNGSTSVGYSSTTRIGTAYVRGVSYDSGMIGTGADVYRVYLFNVKMDAGKNFRDVKSVIYYNSGVKGVADIVLQYNAALNANVASIQQSTFNNMIFPIGQNAIVPGGFSDTQFVYRNRTQRTFDILATGGMSVPLDSVTKGIGNESYYDSGTLSNSQKTDFIVVPTSTGSTTAKAGSVTANSGTNVVTGSGLCTFLSDYNIGDYITISGVTKRITAIANNTYLQVSSNYGSTLSVLPHNKTFPAGIPIDFTKPGRTVTVTSNTATFSLNEALSGTFNAVIYSDVLRSNTVSIQKDIKKNVHVAINCASHSAGSTGPWSLGLADVLKINAIYVNSNSFSNSGVNYINSFKFDNGQRDTHYELASITNLSKSLDSSSRILIDLDVFVPDQSSGVGFFNASSYPIDDANTANTTAITTSQIPQYTSTAGNVFDLRDCIDFRPFANNTANTSSNTTNWSSTATVNPSGVLTFNVDPAYGSFLPSPDSSFQSDLQYYLPRKDRAIIRTTGEFVIIEGEASNNPVPPPEPPGSMSLGIVDVPPFPSLSTNEAKLINRYDYAVTATITQNKRYTMKDINTLSNKIDNLEYYTALTFLEKSAKDTLVRSSVTGQNRFQNGILVDPFNGHDIGDTRDPRYSISIDPIKKMRPAFQQFHIPMRFNQELSDTVNGGAKVVRKGNAVILAHSEVKYISQPYASKLRNCIEGNIYTYQGEITFDPPGDTAPDINTAPDVVTNIDLASNFINMTSAYSTSWGNWNTLSSTSSTTQGGRNLTSSVTDSNGNVTKSYNTQTVVTTTQQQQRLGQQITATSGTTNYNLGTYVTDVQILPYVRSRRVNVYARGLKPNTRVYIFMNDIDVNAWFKQTDSTLTIPANSPFGTPVVSDAYGNVYGVFIIPSGTFKATTLEMQIVDVPDLTVGEDAITTRAIGTYYASNISIAKGSSILSAREAVLSVKEVRDEQTINSSVTVDVPSYDFIPAPPPPQVITNTIYNTIYETVYYPVAVAGDYGTGTGGNDNGGCSGPGDAGTCR